jgi:hypothetical protein
MNRSLIAALVAASLHLLVAALGALRVDLSAAGPVGAALARYAALSGASAARGFFAPDLPAEPRASFEVASRDGRFVPVPLDPDAHGDSEHRVQGVVARGMVEDKAACRSIAASCASRILAQAGDAQGVVVQLSTYDLPRMEEIRRGASPGWTVLYEARFVPRERRP